MKYTVYGLIDPFGECVYVGCTRTGAQQRIKYHRMPSSKASRVLGAETARAMTLHVFGEYASPRVAATLERDLVLSMRPYLNDAFHNMYLHAISYGPRPKVYVPYVHPDPSFVSTRTPRPGGRQGPYRKRKKSKAKKGK